jgi:hypothetical protein
VRNSHAHFDKVDICRNGYQKCTAHVQQSRRKRRFTTVIGLNVSLFEIAAHRSVLAYHTDVNWKHATCGILTLAGASSLDSASRKPLKRPSLSLPTFAAASFAIAIRVGHDHQKHRRHSLCNLKIRLCLLR